ncbi:hypothetical protein AKJ52_02730 [candidate division MSBL1 archaeon SCGC-AAA382C18]|uniref:Uncharacterized protein n=1 Tax=candidate division MSBL1 archaeon SCGC-AAA382C18 TaxID=1698281 RepID=A0A133VHR9_9EURY|nr:hypothetical protein AKJ52_02730 [candidate division MSBL1 archaeon SCGC-AAA382C18]
MKQFQGYERPDGSVGVRNKILVISPVDCSYSEASKIATSVPGATAITQYYGCHRDKMIENQFTSLAENPNIGGVLLVGQGCESITVDNLMSKIEKTGKPVESVTSQEDGGTLKTIEKGKRLIRDISQKISDLEKEPFDIGKLTVAVHCGGSDSTSGLAANPATGRAIDKLIEAGGSSIFSEAPEMIGGEDILAERAEDEEVAKEIYDLINKAELWVKARLGEPRFMSKGNKEGGLTTLEEKSLGAILKGGSKKIKGVLENSHEKLEKPKEPGLYLQDGTSTTDVSSITQKLAAGAQIAVFTTGRGATMGHAIAPVIKVTGNPLTYEEMEDDMDINAGKIIEGSASIEEVGNRIFEEIVDVASDKTTKSESLGYDNFDLWRYHPAIRNLIKKVPKEKL